MKLINNMKYLNFILTIIAVLLSLLLIKNVDFGFNTAVYAQEDGRNQQQIDVQKEMQGVPMKETAEAVRMVAESNKEIAAALTKIAEEIGNLVVAIKSNPASFQAPESEEEISDDSVIIEPSVAEEPTE